MNIGAKLPICYMYKKIINFRRSQKKTSLYFPLLLLLLLFFFFFFFFFFLQNSYYFERKIEITFTCALTSVHIVEHVRLFVLKATRICFINPMTYYPKLSNQFNIKHAG